MAVDGQDGQDMLPDLAIGRLTVAQPHEVEAIVAKTIRHMQHQPDGPNLGQTVWAASQDTHFQQPSREAAALAAARGFGALTIYPQPDEADNAAHQARLRHAWDAGPLLVHFYGHGGRYIWRTGPPDYHKNHDLFTLDDLDQLAPTACLPVVLSMTCFSAPFDHPNADSIGEKLLRLPDRGAVAVVAASWRVDPSPTFSAALVRAMLAPGTVGEALLRAKRETQETGQIALYNLLGDPAVPLRFPQ